MTESFVMMRTRSWTCALQVPHVVESMRPQPLRPLREGPSYVRGAAIIRGSVLPVVDLEELLGGSPAESFGRFVAVRTGERQAVLAVDEVVGVRTIDEHVLHELPALLAGTASRVVESLAAIDRDLLLVLRTARIVPESAWDSLGREAGLP